MTIKKFFTYRIVCFSLITGGFCAFAPIDFLLELEQRYQSYQEKYPSVKINLIFNQPSFAPGDTTFFSAWYLNEELLPVKGEHIVTLDLLNGKGSTVQKIRFKVKNGRGSNQMVLRTDLPPAEYKFVAYTDWMRNFGEPWFYQKSVQILSRNKIHTHKENTIKFYPEGGTLVETLLSKVIVIGPSSSELFVKDSYDSEVAKVSLDSTGIGSFFITPKPNQSYYVNWPITEKKWALPTALIDGVAVNMELKDKCQALLSLPPNSKWADKEIYAIVNSRGKIVFSKKIIIKPGETYHLQIPLREKSDAYHQLFIFDSDNQLLAERVFISYQENRVSANLEVTPTTAKQRQSISFKVDVKDDHGYPLESDLSITVLQRNIFDNYHFQNNFYLFDLPSVMERAEKYGVENLVELNDFLVTQKWQRTKWNAILKNQIPSLLFPFQSSVTLTGHIASKTSGLPPPDSTVIISFLQKNTIGYEAYTKNGKFTIPLIFDFWGDDQIFCTLQHKSKNIDSDYDIFIVKDSINIQDRWSSSETTKTSAYGEFAFNQQIITKSYSFFGSAQNASVSDQGPNSILEEEFLGADASIKIADYVLFPTMEDLLREVVPFVQFQKKGTRQIIKMTYRFEKSVKIFGEGPLYIVDGFMSKDTPFFLSIKPENLISIKVINNPNKLAQLGKLGENGVIFIESKKQNQFNTAAGNNIFQIAGQSSTSNFFKPAFLRTNKSERVPDLRSNYYWAPALKTGKSGSRDVTFFVGDDTGPIIVQVEGLTKDGIPFRTEKTITVEYNPTMK